MNKGGDDYQVSKRAEMKIVCIRECVVNIRTTID